MPVFREASGIYHGVIEAVRYENGVMWAQVWIPSWSSPNLKYITSWAPIAIPWGTFNYGVWGSPQRGEHVWVAFEQGEPERPVIIGFVPMPQVVNERGKTATEMPPEFVNDCPYDKSPHTGIRDDPPKENPPINPAWIAKTPQEYQFFLLHDKLKKAVIRVADGAAAPPPPAPNPENINGIGGLVSEAIRTMGVEAGLKFLQDVLTKVVESPEFLALEAEKLVNAVIDKGCKLLKELTGIGVNNLQDLIAAAKGLVGELAGAVDLLGGMLESIARVPGIVGAAVQAAIDWGCDKIEELTGIDVRGVVSTIGDVINKGLELIGETSKVLDFVGSVVREVEGAISGLADSVGNLVGEVVDWAIDKVKELTGIDIIAEKIGDVLEAAKAIFGTNNKFINFFDGLVRSVANLPDRVVNEARDLAAAAVQWGSDQLYKLTGVNVKEIVQDMGDVVEQAQNLLENAEDRLALVAALAHRAGNISEYVHETTSSLVQVALEQGYATFKDISGIDVRAVVETLGDLIEQAEKILGETG